LDDTVIGVGSCLSSRAFSFELFIYRFDNTAHCTGLRSK